MWESFNHDMIKEIPWIWTRRITKIGNPYKERFPDVYPNYTNVYREESIETEKRVYDYTLFSVSIL